MNEITQITNKLINHYTLTEYEAQRAMHIIIKNGATPSQIAAYITALSTKNIQVSEIIGTLEALKQNFNPIESNVLDTIFIRSTGYEYPPTINITQPNNSIINNLPNISFATAAILNAAGMKVIISANICNNHFSTYQILKDLGYNLSLDIDSYNNILENAGFVFIPDKLFLPKMIDFHYVAQELDFLNILDLTLPLFSPIKADFHYYGLYKQNISNMIIAAMKQAQIQNGCVIANNLGYDKIIPEANNIVTDYNNIRNYNYSLLNKNLTKIDNYYDYKNLILSDALIGNINLYHHLIIANTAPALVLCKKASNLEEAEELASSLLQTKEAFNSIKNMIHYSSSL